MLNQLKLFFDQHIALYVPDQFTDKNLHLARATLFIEMMTLDDKIQIEEQKMIL